jgi:hypothetical protein
LAKLLGLVLLAIAAGLGATMFTAAFAFLGGTIVCGA